jgi:hypothetical protein
MKNRSLSPVTDCFPATAIANADRMLESVSSRDGAAQPVLNIDARIIRNSKKCCPAGVNEHWFISGDCYMVEFFDNHVMSRIIFDNKGKQLSMVKCFGDDKFQPEIRDLIKRCYPDLAVTSFTEVIRENRSYYIIQLENKIRLMKLRIGNGEIHVIENCSKN